MSSVITFKTGVYEQAISYSQEGETIMEHIGLE